jgi:ribonucleases P/MRP protein subunit RPP40
MHIAHDVETVYYLADHGQMKKLNETECEKDLGVFTTMHLKPSLQCRKSAEKATSILRMIKRNFNKIDVDDFRILYRSYIRPHLEYCVLAWNPYLRKDIDCLESIQRRATKIVSSICSRQYQERLEILGLSSLEKRRLRGDLIEMFKILTRRERVDYRQFFELSAAGHGLRGHSLKLFKPRCKLNSRRYSFSQRAIDDWNALPSEVVESTSTNMFKNRLDNFWTV